MRWLCLGGLAAATAGLMALLGWELVSNPRDLWLAGLYLAGTLTGVALTWCRKRLS